MYKGYTLRSVLNEYAISFFTLLEEGYKQKYKDLHLWAYIVSVPSMQPNDRSAFLEGLRSASASLDDILIDGDDYSGIEKLKENL